MASKSERHVLFFDLKLSAHSRSHNLECYDGLTPLSGKKIFDLIAQTVATGRKIISVAKKTKQVYIQDITVNQKWASLLINVSDKDAANPTIADPIKNTRRRVKRDPDEGLEGSLHITVNLDSVMPHVYTAVIECTPGLPSSRVQQLLNFYVRLSKKTFANEFLVDDPTGAMTKDGKFKKIPISIKAELLGQPSKQLEQDINSGTLLSLELVELEESAKAWDTEGYVTTKSFTTALQVKPIDRPGLKHWSLLCQVFQKASIKRGAQVRVKFKTFNGLYRTVLIDPRAVSAIDEERYVRKEVLNNFSCDLESSYDQLFAELIDKMQYYAR